MARYRRLFRCFVSALFLLFLLFYGAPGAEERKETHQISGAYLLSVTLNDGLLTFDSDRAPLRAVLKELSEKTGAAFFLRTSSVSTDLLSVSFRDLTVPEAIERVLRRYNYVLECGGGSGSTRVILLTPQGSGDLFPWDTVNNGALISVASPQGSGDLFPQDKVNNTGLISAAPPQSPPESLDECQKLDFTRDAAPANQANLYPDPQNPYLYEAQIRASNRIALENASILRAEKVFTMGRCSHLWERAIDELKYIQDERVATLLADLAQNGKTVALKTTATQALWLNTAKSGFKDTQAINVLQGLSASTDEGVSWYAREALQDYEKYTSRINSGSKGVVQERKPSSFYKTNPQ